MNRGRITIHSVTAADAGLYVCKAADAMATAYLSVEPGNYQRCFCLTTIPYKLHQSSLTNAITLLITTNRN
jgi:hypothetical protein